MKEKEYPEKFYFILKGQVQKLHQRPYNEIQQDIETRKEKEAALKLQEQETPHLRKRTATIVNASLKKFMSQNSIDSKKHFPSLKYYEEFQPVKE